MGRKALPDSEKKSKIIIIRLTEAEYKQVDEKAWASRRSKSEFARDAINRYLNSADSDKDCLPFSKKHSNNQLKRAINPVTLVTGYKAPLFWGSLLSKMYYNDYR